jgi:hypothetical protein
MSVVYDGRLWERGDRWVAYVKVAGGIDPDLRIDEVEKAVVKSTCIILLARSAARLDKDVRRVCGRLGPRDAWFGITYGDCQEWVTPLLRDDVVGPAVTRAARLAHAVSQVSDDESRKGIWLAIDEATHQEWPGADQLLVVTKTIKGIPYAARLQEVRGPEAADGAAVAPPLGGDVGTPPGDGAPPESDEAGEGRAAPACAMIVDLVGSTALLDDRGQWQNALADIRSVATAHVPALLQLCPPLPREGTAKVAERLQFEFTGDGFALFVATEQRRGFVDWAATVALEIRRRGTPARVGIAASSQAQETRGGLRSNLVKDLDTLTAVAGTGAAFALVVDESLHATMLQEWPAVRNAFPPVHVAIPQAHGCARPRCARVLRDIDHDQLCEALDGPRPTGASGLLSGYLAPFALFFRPWLPSTRVPLRDRTVPTSLARSQADGTWHAVLEGVLTLAVCAALADTAISPLAFASIVAFVAMVAFAFGLLGNILFDAFFLHRVLPTLRRYHFQPAHRERFARLSVRLRAAFARGAVVNRREVLRNVGWLGAWAWLPEVVFGPGVSHRRWLKRLPRPDLTLLTAATCAVGALWYVLVAGVLAVVWGLTPQATSAALVAVLFGLAWNLAFFLRVQQVSLAVLYLSHGDLRHIAAVGLRIGNRHAAISEVAHAAALGAIGFALGREIVVEGALQPHTVASVGTALIALVASWQHSRWPRREAESLAEGWLDAFVEGRLRGDGHDLSEGVDLYPMRGVLRILLARGDLLLQTLRFVGVRRNQLDARFGAPGEDVSGFVVDQHGAIHGNLPGELMAFLGWHSRQPGNVSEVYADGRFAARMIQDLARHADEKQEIEISDVLGSGPVQADGTLHTAPVTLRVKTLNPGSLAAGYFAWAIVRPPVAGHRVRRARIRS